MTCTMQILAMIRWLWTSGIFMFVDVALSSANINAFVFPTFAIALWRHLSPVPPSDHGGLPDRARFLSNLRHASSLDASEHDEDKCSICWDPLDQPVRSSCSHVNCRDCLLTWFDKVGDNCCPQCRRKLFVDNRRPEEMCIRISVVAYACILHILLSFVVLGSLCWFCDRETISALLFITEAAWNYFIFTEVAQHIRQDGEGWWRYLSHGLEADVVMAIISVATALCCAQILHYCFAGCNLNDLAVHSRSGLPEVLEVTTSGRPVPEYRLHGLDRLGRHMEPLNGFYV
jgi:hypothetical protein